MIYKSFTIIGAMTLLSAVAQAGSAPKELYGKSITVQWSESVTGRKGGDQVTRNWFQGHLINIYISSAGRLFVRRTGSGDGSAGRAYGGMGAAQPSGHGVSTAPGQSDAQDRVDFQGRSIVVYSEFQSGARRIAVDLYDGGTGCKATVINGKQAGKNIVQQNSVRGEIEVSSIQIGSSVTCSVRDGNVFAQ
jgi:hypothetical protein